MSTYVFNEVPKLYYHLWQIYFSIKTRIKEISGCGIVLECGPVTLIHILYYWTIASVTMILDSLKIFFLVHLKEKNKSVLMPEKHNFLK